MWRHLSQPHFWKSVRITLTLPKWGLGSPLGLPKFQSSITRVKTLRLEAFFISLEIYQSVNVENGLAWAIWTFAAQVVAKRKVGSQIANLISDHEKLGIDPTPVCVGGVRHTLERSQGELQVFFRPHPNQRSKQIVMNLQSFESPNRDSFRTFPWESRDKKPFGCKCCGETHILLYGGRWWFPSSPGHGESCESRVAHGLS
jgi:hypothetical protein